LNKKKLLLKSKKMGYGVEAGAFIGVTIMAPSDETLKRVEALCAEFGLGFTQIVYDDDDTESWYCIYVQRLELEVWGHGAEINRHREDVLSVTESHKADIAEILAQIGEKPQSLQLVLSLHGG
jgi:hypothetical protein